MHCKLDLVTAEIEVISNEMSNTVQFKLLLLYIYLLIYFYIFFISYFINGNKLFSNTKLNCAQALALEVFLGLLVLRAHRDHRAHQAVTLDQFPTAGPSLGRASALRSRNIYPVSYLKMQSAQTRFTSTQPECKIKKIKYIF